jgi:hypothetical protein
MMKAMIAGAAALAMLTGAVMNTETENKEIPGGWTESDEPEMTEELKEIFEIATEDLIDVTYTDKDGNALMQIRKAAGEDDISGDYNAYDSAEEIPVGSKTVTLKGNDQMVSLMIFTEDGYSYSVSMSEGLSREDALKLAEMIH